MRAFAKTNFTMLAMLFAGTLALAVVSVLAQTSPSTPAVQGQTLSGNVVNVDSPGKVIKIKDDQGKEIIIYVDSGTKMQSLEKSLELSDIKAGDHVVVSVKGDSGRMLATAITVHKAQQSAESSTTSSSTESARSDLRNTDMMDRSQRISKTDETTTTSTMARTSDYDSSQSAVSTGRLPKTATPLPLVGMIGLLLVSAGAVARKIFG